MIIDQFEEFMDEMASENVSEDYWYDVGVDEAQNMLDEFLQEDWDALNNLIMHKLIEWQKRVIYSFDGENIEQEIRIILNIISTNDKELFEICIDSLRCLINEKTKNIILEKPELLEKVRSLTVNNNSITQKIYMDFLSKLKVRENHECSTCHKNSNIE